MHEGVRLVGRQRAAQVIALDLVATQFHELVEDFGSFHALGQEAVAQGVAELDHAAHDIEGAGIGADGPDQGLVELEYLGREVVQASEIAIAGAEVVERHAHAHCAGCLDAFQGGAFRQHSVLGAFDLEPRRSEPVPGEGILEHAGETGLLEVARRHVDRHVHLQAGVFPRAYLGQRRVEHPFGDGLDVGGLLQQGNEVAGRHRAQLGMVPAKQGLQAGVARGSPLELRLVNQPEFSRHERAGNAGHEFVGAAVAEVHRGVVAADGRAGHRLVVERGVGAPQGIDGVGRLQGEGGQADPPPLVDDDARARRQRRDQGVQQLLRELRHGLFVGGLQHECQPGDTGVVHAGLAADEEGQPPARLVGQLFDGLHADGPRGIHDAVVRKEFEQDQHAVLAGRGQAQSVEVLQQLCPVGQQGGLVHARGGALQVDLGHHQGGQVFQLPLLCGVERTGNGVDEAQAAQVVVAPQDQGGSGIEADVRWSQDERVGGEARVLQRVFHHHDFGGPDGVVAEGILAAGFAHGQADLRLEPLPVRVHQTDERDGNAEKAAGQPRDAVELLGRRSVQQTGGPQGRQPLLFCAERKGHGGVRKYVVRAIRPKWGGA